MPYGKTGAFAKNVYNYLRALRVAVEDSVLWSLENGARKLQLHVDWIEQKTFLVPLVSGSRCWTVVSTASGQDETTDVSSTTSEGPCQPPPWRRRKNDQGYGTYEKVQRQDPQFGPSCASSGGPPIVVGTSDDGVDVDSGPPSATASGQRNKPDRKRKKKLIVSELREALDELRAEQEKMQKQREAHMF